MMAIIRHAQDVFTWRRLVGFRLCIRGFDGLGPTPASLAAGRAIVDEVQPRLDALKVRLDLLWRADKGLNLGDLDDLDFLTSREFIVLTAAWEAAAEDEAREDEAREAKAREDEALWAAGAEAREAARLARRAAAEAARDREIEAKAHARVYDQTWS